MSKITWKQCGQPRAYADSIYHGEVDAATAEEARAKAEESHGRPIRDKEGTGDDWSLTYFAMLPREIRPGVFEFKFITPSTS